MIHQREFKKAHPQPMFEMGSHVSLQIYKKGLYYILKEFEMYHCEQGTFLHFYHNLFEHSLPKSLKKLPIGMFASWVNRLFYIGGEVVYGTKTFHNEGVIHTTYAVQVSVYYMKCIFPNPMQKRRSLPIQGHSPMQDKGPKG